MAELKLKRCPFCGGEARIKVMDKPDIFNEYYWQTAFIVCGDCGCRTASVDPAPNYKEELSEAWNRRADNGNKESA